MNAMRRHVPHEILCAEAPSGERAHLVLFANLRWLPLETAYAQEIGGERRSGLRVGQVGMLQSHACGSATILRLFEQAWQRLRRFGLDVVYIAVDPDDVSFYGRFLFEPTGWDRRCWEFADYAPVEVLRLDVRTTPQRMTDALRRRFTEGDPS